MERDASAATGKDGRAEIRRILTFLVRLPRPYWKSLDRHDAGAASDVVRGILGHLDDGGPKAIPKEKIVSGFRALTRQVHPDQFLHLGDGDLVEQATTVQSLLLLTRGVGLSLAEETFHRQRKTYNTWLHDLRETAEQARQWGYKAPPPSPPAPTEPARSPKPAAAPRERRPAAPRTAARSPRPAAAEAPATRRKPKPQRAEPPERFVRPAPTQAPDAVGALSPEEVRWILLVARLQANGWRDVAETAFYVLGASRRTDSLDAEQAETAQELVRQFASSPVVYEHFLDAERAVFRSDLWNVMPFRMIYMQEVASERLKERIRPTPASQANHHAMSPQMVERYVRDIQHELSIPDQQRIMQILRRHEAIQRSGKPVRLVLQRGEEQLFGRFRAAVSRVLRGRSPDQREAIWDGLMQALRTGEVYS